MKHEFRNLRLSQLQRGIAPFLEAKGVPRPQKGWIRAIREATGVTVRAMAKRLGKAPSVAANFERSEAEYRITLGSLRDAAEALGCQLIYALVPKNGNIQELAEERARTTAAENVFAVEHSMALENQAVGGIEKKIREETRRILKRKTRSSGKSRKKR